MPISKIPGAGLDTGSSGVAPGNLTTGGPSWDGSGNLSFNSGYGSTAVAYGCRAWCYFNNSQALVASANISSITINGTGDIWINFTNNMPDANYAVIATTNEDGGTAKIINATQPAVNRVRIVTFNLAGTKVNNTYNYVAIFR